VYVRRLDYSAKARRFRVTTEDDQIINADRVVVAVGFKYFKHLPAEVIRNIPAGRISHTCDLVSFAELAGKRCLIVGGRQSAFEWAALIHEAGAAAVHICHRHDSPAFRAADWSWVNPLVDLIAKDPSWFRKLSAAKREEVNYRLWAEGRLKVEPWLESRVLKETITVRPKSQIVVCAEQPGGDLAVRLDDGETLVVDHVLAATGYKVDSRGQRSGKTSDSRRLSDAGRAFADKYPWTFCNGHGCRSGFRAVLGLHNRRPRLSSDNRTRVQPPLSGGQRQKLQEIAV
jgi:lysine/ornithine N-monooxygenase